jgi:Transcription factor WhiB
MGAPKSAGRRRTYHALQPTAMTRQPVALKLVPAEGFDDTPACAGRAPLWDYDAGEDANGQAKAICHTCPLQQWCLAIGVRDKLSGVWGGVSLLDGEPYVVSRLSNLSTHRHRANGEPLCDACVDVKAAQLHRRRELDRARDRTKKVSSA